MDQFLIVLWSAIGTVVTGLVTWLTSYLVGLISSKVKDQKLQSFLVKATEITMACVNSLNQTVVADMKTAGTFDAASAAKVKENCIKLIEDQLAPDMIKFIQENFGDVETYLSTQIESLVFKSKDNSASL